MTDYRAPRRTSPMPVAIPADWPSARAAGRARQQLRNIQGSSQRINAAQPDLENIVGAVAERALAAYAGLPVPEFLPDRIKDAGFEFLTRRGRIDTKGAKVEPWFLAAKYSALRKDPGADLYVLVYCPLDCATCWVMGYATRAEMAAGIHTPTVLNPKQSPRFSGTFKDEPGRYLETARLHDAGELLAAITTIRTPARVTRELHADDLTWD